MWITHWETGKDCEKTHFVKLAGIKQNLPFGAAQDRRILTIFYKSIYNVRYNEGVGIISNASDCRQSPRLVPRAFLLKEPDNPLFSGFSGSFLV